MKNIEKIVGYVLLAPPLISVIAFIISSRIPAYFNFESLKGRLSRNIYANFVIGQSSNLIKAF